MYTPADAISILFANRENKRSAVEGIRGPVGLIHLPYRGCHIAIARDIAEKSVA